MLQRLISNQRKPPSRVYLHLKLWIVSNLASWSSLRVISARVASQILLLKNLINTMGFFGVLYFFLIRYEVAFIFLLNAVFVL